MTRHLVTMLVGVVVDAETPQEARRKASAPFEYGAIPGLVGMAMTGSRLVTPEDEAGIRDRILQMSVNNPSEDVA